MDMTSDRRIRTFSSGSVLVRTDTLVNQSEVFLRINRAEPVRLACSPGDLGTLCTGYLLTEGWLGPGMPAPEVSILGGEASVSLPGIIAPPEPGPVDSPAVFSLETVMETVQAFGRLSVLHHRTGGTHSAALAMNGSILCHSEDISRSSALERAAGAACLGTLPLHESVLLLSSRVPSGFIHKAARAGIPLVAAISAPTAQAVDEAERLGVCLCGFVRDSTANIYSCGWRVGL